MGAGCQDDAPEHDVHPLNRGGPAVHGGLPAGVEGVGQHQQARPADLGQQNDALGVRSLKAYCLADGGRRCARRSGAYSPRGAGQLGRQVPGEDGGAARIERRVCQAGKGGGIIRGRLDIVDQPGPSVRLRALVDLHVARIDAPVVALR